MTVNDTTNTLTTRFIFGSDKKPQDQFHYRDMSLPVKSLDPSIETFLKKACPGMMNNSNSDSILPYFKGYTFENGKSTYRGDEVGEGGYVYAEPGIHHNVALLDVVSMHPNSLISECFFGPYFTERFMEIVYARVAIKHEEWDEVNTMLGGKLTKYVELIKKGEMTSKSLANALKTAVNSVYGLTSANFDNPFRDIRNKDNIVAKRGALFMIDLKNEVQKRGFTVAHIKTDSIKIPNATRDIIDFVMDFGTKYGYAFEHEATYDRMCLVNDAVYVARYASVKKCNELYGYVPGDCKRHEKEWTATGTQFQIPYVFKTLFSKEGITFDDKIETKAVTSALYLDMNEALPDVTENENELVKLEKTFKKGVMDEAEYETRKEELKLAIATGHNYMFVGKVGAFCPIMSGHGGGILVREKEGK